MKEIHKRSISGLLFAVILLVSILLGPWSFALLFGLFSIFILREFYKLSKIAGISPQKNLGIIIGAIIFIFTFLHVRGIVTVNLFGLCFSSLFVIPAYELFRAKKNSIENIAITIFGVLYIIYPISLLNFFVYPDIPLNNRYDPTLLIFFFILIWVYDSGAYLFGVTFGKHRLFERISPKKSWEGFFGGWVLSLVFALVLHHFFPRYELVFMLSIASITSVSGTIGDLVESMIKRNLGLKDSGKFLPGHGGLLDRFDSILFASPFVYLYINFFG